MKSLKPGLKFIGRGFADNIILLPGWASDWRIFSGLNLDYNYLIPVRCDIDSFRQGLSDSLDQAGIGEISLLGFSMGGFLAAELAAQYPKRIKELILVSIREKFEPGAIKEAKAQIEKNKQAFLYKFYLNCFSESDKEGLCWFKKNLLPSYLDSFSPAGLIAGLSYLENAVISPGPLREVRKIRIFHGGEDKICPLAEAGAVASFLPQAEFKGLAGLGHIMFLNQGFRDEFYRAQ